jgi:hypothetical protein
MQSTATVHDMTLGHLCKKIARHNAQTGDVPRAEASEIFSDMADGILALDFALSFAKFDYDARQLVLSVVGLLGNDSKPLAMYDDDLADHLKSSVRTVRRWRSEYVKVSQKENFGFIEITEGEYDRDKQRYAPTRYRFAEEGRFYVERVINEARHTEEYGRDRRGAIERAAREHYEDIPNAPLLRRKTKPKQSQSLKIERDFENAGKSLTKGRNALAELSERSRAALLSGAQGRELHALLLKLQADVAEILQDFPQTIDEADVGYMPAKLAGIPPTEETVESSGNEVRSDDETSGSVYSSLTLPEVSDAFSKYDERLRVKPKSAEPKVRRVELEIVAEPASSIDSPVSDDQLAAFFHPKKASGDRLAGFVATKKEPDDSPPDDLTVELDPVELAERVAVQAVACGMEFDDEGEITFVPPDVPDDVYEAVWRVQPPVLRKRQEQRE